MKKLALLALLSLTLAVNPVFAGPKELTFQSSDQPGIFMYQMAENFTKWVDEMSAGQLKINVTSVGSVVQYNETLDAVSSGILQGEFTEIGRAHV